jgi:hypothetical protein
VGPLRQRLGRESSVPIREERGDGPWAASLAGPKRCPTAFLQNPIFFSFFFSVFFAIFLDNFKLNFKTTFELVKLFPLFGELQGDLLK